MGPGVIVGVRNQLSNHRGGGTKMDGNGSHA